MSNARDFSQSARLLKSPWFLNSVHCDSGASAFGVPFPVNGGTIKFQTTNPSAPRERGAVGNAGKIYPFAPPGSGKGPCCLSVEDGKVSGRSKTPVFCIFHRSRAAKHNSPHLSRFIRSSSPAFRQRFLASAQVPNLPSKRGGSGDAGTSEHQFGLRSAAGVGCWALVPGTIRYQPTSTSAAAWRSFTSFPRVGDRWSRCTQRRVSP